MWYKIVQHILPFSINDNTLKNGHGNVKSSPHILFKILMTYKYIYSYSMTDRIFKDNEFEPKKMEI